MAATSVSLGEHFAGFVSRKVKTGQYRSASDVVRAALRLLEEHEERRVALRQVIAEGEASGYVEDFDAETFRASLLAGNGAR